MERMKKKRILIFLLFGSILLSFGVGFEREALSPPVQIGSNFPPISRGDKALARVAEAEKEKLGPGKKQAILSELVSMEKGDEEMDNFLLDACGYIEHHEDVRNALSTKCNANQYLRLIDSLEGKNFRVQKILLEEFTKLFPDHEAIPNVRFFSARNHIVCDTYEAKGLDRMEQLIKDYPDTPVSRSAQIYLEAVKGPESIAGLEAAHEIARIQTYGTSNNLRAALMNMTVVESCQKRFFREFLESDLISSSEKADILYKTLIDHHMVNKQEDVERIARQILKLNPADKYLRDRASFSIAMSFFMRGDHEKAIEELERYIEEWPMGLDADRALLMIGKSRHMMLQMAEALAMYDICGKLNPDSEAGKEALHLFKTIMDHNKYSELESQIQSISISRLEDIKEHKNRYLAKLQKEKDGETEKVSTVVSETPRPELFKRLGELQLVSLTDQEDNSNK